MPTLPLPPRPKGSYQTLTGIWFNVFEPTPEMVSLKDIANALSKACRFGGHLPDFYSVAQHSVLVSRLCPPEFAVQGLFHDASEAYLLDLPRPAKYHPSFQIYRDIEAKVEVAVAAALGFSLPLPPEVKAADNKALAVEALRLKGVAPGDPYWEPWLSEFTAEFPELLKFHLYAQDPRTAHEDFVRRCVELGFPAAV